MEGYFNTKYVNYIYISVMLKDSYWYNMQIFERFLTNLKNFNFLTILTVQQFTKTYIQSEQVISTK